MKSLHRLTSPKEADMAGGLVRKKQGPLTICLCALGRSEGVGGGQNVQKGRTRYRGRRS